MSYSTKFENFNNSYMLFTSSSFYFSSILMILMCILLDEGTGIILRLFSCVKDQKFGMKCQNEEIKCLESYPINEQSTKIEKSCTQ
jgi:hypothetical protein